MPTKLRGTNPDVTRIGLVLGAGGVTGDAFHRGLLRALSEVGYDARSADVIVGTSAGSMVGAFLRRPDRRLGATLRHASVHGQRLGSAPDLSPLLAALRQPWRARAGAASPPPCCPPPAGPPTSSWRTSPGATAASGRSNRFTSWLPAAATVG